LGLMVEIAINICMEHHYYIYDGKVKKQQLGAGIGLRLSEALGRAFGLWWDGKLLEKLERLGWKPKMLKRYVDDVNTVVQALKAGTNYNATEKKLEIVEEKVEHDHGKEVDRARWKYLEKLLILWTQTLKSRLISHQRTKIK